MIGAVAVSDCCASDCRPCAEGHTSSENLEPLNKNRPGLACDVASDLAHWQPDTEGELLDLDNMVS